MTYPKNDSDFEDVTIKSARAEERSGGWSIERSDGWSFFVPKTSPVAPTPGMAARFYGKGIGFSVRGLFLDGREVFYRTQAEHEQHERDERYGKDARDLIRKWDAGDLIHTITMGGFGPNYELALQIAAIEFAREGLDVPLEGPTEGHDAIWSEVCDHAMARITPWFTYGLSGAQFGAARWLAYQWVHGAGPTLAADPKYSERSIMVSRHIPATGPAGVMPSADERMRHDYPILAQFHTKHALGALSAPSCLCCGHQTGRDRPIAVQHMELPAIVVCKPCKDASDGVRGGSDG